MSEQPEPSSAVPQPTITAKTWPGKAEFIKVLTVLSTCQYCESEIIINNKSWELIHGE